MLFLHTRQILFNGIARKSIENFAVSLPHSPLIGVMVSKPDCGSVDWGFKSQKCLLYFLNICLIS